MKSKTMEIEKKDIETVLLEFGGKVLWGWKGRGFLTDEDKKRSEGKGRSNG